MIDQRVNLHPKLHPLLGIETLLDASNATTQAVGSVMGVIPNRMVDVPLVAAQE